MDFEIAGNAALVTASSSGLGKASAVALAREGVDVVVNGRDEERLAAAREEVQSEAAAGADVVAHAGDLTDPDDVAAMVEATVDAFGGIDHLVTSTGGPEPLSTMETTDEDWYDAYDLLAMSVVRLVREAAPHLRTDGGGTIVNITSRTVKEARSTNVLSSSVRMGVIGLEKSLSQELAPEVRANAVLPGSHETPRIQEMFEAAVERGEADSYEEARAARAESIPLQRVGDPMELGNTVAFLSSPKSGFLTGVAIPITGGSHASTL
jgi:3-oxoacyl-[acyl-carrier protein] reductase